MDYKLFKQLVSAIKIGKQLPDSVYVHESAISYAPTELTATVLKVAEALKISDDQWNILKFNKRDFKITFLSYPGFEIDSYPSLEHSYTVDLTKLSVREAQYGKSENPPILHRKETFVDVGYPPRKLFREITAEG